MSKSKFNVPALVKIFADCIATGIRKNHDYGAARDTILANGLLGVAVRMDDKMARILSLVQPGHEQAVKDEGLRDTARDMINYAAYLVMLLDGTWGIESPIAWSVDDWEALFARVGEAAGVPPGLIRFNGYEMPIDRLRTLFEAHGKPLDSTTKDKPEVFPITNCRCMPGKIFMDFPGEEKISAFAENSKQDKKGRKKKRTAGFLIPAEFSKRITSGIGFGKKPKAKKRTSATKSRKK